MPAKYFTLALTLAFYLFVPGICLAAPNEEIVGWLEKVKLSPSDLVVHGKLDTGADYSSLNADNLESYEKSGKPWVRFTVTNRFGKTAKFEQEVLRTAMVKKRKGSPETRPVVRLGICIGSRYMEADVNLVNRRNFENQMLIGRSFLAGNVIINPALTFTSDPACRKGNSH